MVCPITQGDHNKQYRRIQTMPVPFRLPIFTARAASIASAVLAIAIPSVRPSVRPSVCLSVRHTPVLCQNDGT